MVAGKNSLFPAYRKSNYGPASSGHSLILTMGFFNPPDMPAAIDEYCKLTDQKNAA
jgi:hypothetical protein